MLLASCLIGEVVLEDARVGLAFERERRSRREKLGSTEDPCSQSRDERDNVQAEMFWTDQLKSSPSSRYFLLNGLTIILRHLTLSRNYFGCRTRRGESRVTPWALRLTVKSKEMSDSKQQQPQPGSGSLGRTACSFCRRRKLKCDRRSPCESCQKFGFECEYAGISSGSSKPDVKSSRVRQLEDRLGQS